MRGNVTSGENPCRVNISERLRPKARIRTNTQPISGSGRCICRMCNTSGEPLCSTTMAFIIFINFPFISSYDGVSSWINPSHLVRHTIQATTTYRSIPHHAYFPYSRRIFNVHMSASEATLHIISIDLKHSWPTRVMDTKSFHSLINTVLPNSVTCDRLYLRAREADFSAKL